MAHSLSPHRLYGLTFILSLFLQLVAAQHWDGPSPYGQKFAPDVTSVVTGWDVSYPSFEGNNSYPQPIINGSDGLGTSTLTARAAKDFYLRILPLGASITEGSASSDGNGYRKWLRQQLRWKGWKVNMVGSKTNGNMADRDNEGHPGWVITQVHDAFVQVANMKPNLVLINIGTNDCSQNIDTGNAGARMKSLIDDIYSRIPGVTVILSTLVKSRDYDSCASSLSQQYRDLVYNTYSGQRIGLADINSVISMSQVSGDGIHPTDDGYKLFAAVWWDAISKLEDGIQPPASDGTVNDAVSGVSTCPKVAGNARGPVQTQKGSGHDDGKYVHNRVERGVIESARIQKAGDPTTITQNIPINMFFANLVKGDPNADRTAALDDWIRVKVSTEGVTTYFMRQNLGAGTFGTSKIIDFKMDCPPDSVYEFGDFNGDGLDDFYCIKTGASVWVSLNRGGNPPTFESIGQVVPATSGWGSRNVRIADIDGDGRADFCLVDGVDVKCSRNGGQGDTHSWQGFSTVDGLRGVVFNQEQAPVSAFQFGDINGDFRSDILLVGDNGNVETWTNFRGRGSGIVPEWSSSGITHQGQPATGIRNNIKFAKIYGSNRLDYIYIKEEDDWFDVRVWENTGGGGTKRKGDGIFYCDMRGLGSDDYVWIYMDGHSNEIFGNTHNPPYWDPNIKFSISVPGPRIGIHLADWTGNGRCDVLVQNKATGAVTLWENQWDSGSKTLTFANRGVVASPGCTEGWGVSIFDRGMRIADMDGDGRADIVCLEKGGRLTAWLNRASGMFNAGQIKLTEGWDRANLRLADVENSGRADIIWLDKYTGAGRVWKNNGYAGPNGGGGGSSFSWTSRGVLYSPIDRGECMNFGNIGGLGRADLIQVYPGTNEAYTFFNECGGAGAGGDDGDIVSPGLPDYSSDDNDHIIVPTPVTITIPTPTNTNAPSEVTDGAQPIEANSYFYLDTGSCNTDNKTPEGETYEHFVKWSIYDATKIALAVDYAWPNELTGSSDLYIGKNFHTSDYMNDFKANIHAASKFQSPGFFPFQQYVRVNCYDTYNACGGKIGKDTRNVGAYANNTKGVFGTKYYTITLCPVFFTLQNLYDVSHANTDKDPATFQLIYMETSASKFLHEVMHMGAITENRAHIVDEIFDTGRRIYGPRDVAKAARIANRDGFQYNYKNADTYAVFVMAAYWEYTYGAVISPTVSGAALPAGLREYDAVGDHQDNYLTYEYGGNFRRAVTRISRPIGSFFRSLFS